MSEEIQSYGVPSNFNSIHTATEQTNDILKIVDISVGKCKKVRWKVIVPHYLKSKNKSLVSFVKCCKTKIKYTI